MTEDKKIIEVGGVKLEIDLRHARTVETYKIGDSIKVLTKVYEGYQAHPGIIVGFDNFAKLPSINIAYIDIDYKSAELKFIAFNKNTKDVEICVSDEIQLTFKKSDVINVIDRKIAHAETELAEIKMRKAYFLKNFGLYFEKPKEETEDTPTPF